MILSIPTFPKLLSFYCHDKKQEPRNAVNSAFLDSFILTSYQHNPSANSRQSRSYAGWRPINRQKNTRKNASTLPRLFCLFARLVASRVYSHSIVPIGLGVKSIRTLLIPGTSWVIRYVIW